MPSDFKMQNHYAILCLLALMIVSASTTVFADQPSYSDDFSSDTLSSVWQVFHATLGAYATGPDSFHKPAATGPTYTLVESRGSLRLSTTATPGFDFWYNAEQAPMIQRDPPNGGQGSWAVETKETLVASSGGSFHTGLMIYFGRSDAFIWGFLGSQNQLYWGKVGPGGGPVVYNGGNTVYLRIEKSGNAYTFKFKSQADSSWITVGSMNHDGIPRAVGFITKTWDNGVPATVDFDSFTTFLLPEPASPLPPPSAQPSSPPLQPSTPPPQSSSLISGMYGAGKPPADWKPFATMCGEAQDEISAIQSHWRGFVITPEVVGAPREAVFNPKKLLPPVSWPFAGNTYCVLQGQRNDMDGGHIWSYYLGRESFCEVVVSKVSGSLSEVCCPKKFSDIWSEETYEGKFCCASSKESARPVSPSLCSPPSHAPETLSRPRTQPPTEEARFQPTTPAVFPEMNPQSQDQQSRTIRRKTDSMKLMKLTQADQPTPASPRSRSPGTRTTLPEGDQLLLGDQERIMAPQGHQENPQPPSPAAEKKNPRFYGEPTLQSEKVPQSEPIITSDPISPSRKMAQRSKQPPEEQKPSHGESNSLFSFVKNFFKSFFE